MLTEKRFLKNVFLIVAICMSVMILSASVFAADSNYLGEKISTATDIKMNNYLLSQDGRYMAVWQGDGNFVVYRQSDMKALWSTDTHGKGASKFTFEADGNLVISKYMPPSKVYCVVGYDWVRIWENGYVRYEMVPIYGWKEIPGGYTTLWSSNTSGNSGSTLLMQNDSNLVIYNANGKPVWNCGIRD